MRDIQEDFSQKYDGYGSMIIKIAMTYLGNTADAEDVMKEVFMRLLYKSPEFNKPRTRKALDHPDSRKCMQGYSQTV